MCHGNFNSHPTFEQLPTPLSSIYAVDFLNMFHSIAITVMFNQSMYSVIENAGPARPTLVLSNPSSTDITVQVTNTDGSATGEY